MKNYFCRPISITSFLLCYCLFLFSCIPEEILDSCPEARFRDKEDIEYSCREYFIHDVEIGYGLYSYILFNGKPGPVGSSKFDRYLSLYKAYINTFPQCSKIDPYHPKKNINLMVWPLLPEAKLVSIYEVEKPSHAIFIERYHYAAADTILGKIRGLNNLGPFIVGYRAPLSMARNLQPVEKEMLIVDLTRVSKDSFEDVLMWYKKEVTEDPKTWKNRFDWELIKIHLKDALITHGQPILVAIEWAGDFFGIKELFAKP